MEILKTTLENDGQKWAALLETSGGSLELTKCFYYILSWGWDKYGSPVPQKINEQPPQLSRINIRLPGDTPQFIYQREVTESHKTLGVFKSICGNQDDHMKFFFTTKESSHNKFNTGRTN